MQYDDNDDNHMVLIFHLIKLGNRNHTKSYLLRLYIYIYNIYIKEFEKVYILKNVESLHLKIFNQNIKHFKVLTFQQAF